MAAAKLCSIDRTWIGILALRLPVYFVLQPGDLLRTHLFVLCKTFYLEKKL
jgi:hypothetical protein